MSDVDRQNAEDAAQMVRTTLDHRIQWLGFGLLHKSRTVERLRLGRRQRRRLDGGPGNPTDQRSWLPMGLTGTGASFGTDYRSSSSPMARAIDCFNQSSGQGTDLADPVRMASHELRTHGRPDAIKAILLMSDGQPNTSTGSRTDYCQEAVEVAAADEGPGHRALHGRLRGR